jgi:hypothetical protein
VAIDNPAGRLYALLSRVHALEGQGISIQQAWVKTLGGSRGSVTRALAGYAGLLDEIDRRVSRLNDPAAVSAFEHYAPIWANILFQPNQALTTDSRGLVDPGALAALGMVSALLGHESPDIELPEAAKVGELRTNLISAIDMVRGDATIPSDLRALLVARLHDMLWSLDHLDTVGTEGVRAAAERLAGALVLTPEEKRRCRARMATLRGGEAGPRSHRGLVRGAGILAAERSAVRLAHAHPPGGGASEDNAFRRLANHDRSQRLLPQVGGRRVG